MEPTEPKGGQSMCGRQRKLKGNLPGALWAPKGRRSQGLRRGRARCRRRQPWLPVESTSAGGSRAAREGRIGLVEAALAALETG